MSSGPASIKSKEKKSITSFGYPGEQTVRQTNRKLKSG